MVYHPVGKRETVRIPVFPVARDVFSEAGIRARGKRGRIGIVETESVIAVGSGVSDWFPGAGGRVVYSERSRRKRLSIDEMRLGEVRVRVGAGDSRSGAVAADGMVYGGIDLSDGVQRRLGTRYGLLVAVDVDFQRRNGGVDRNDDVVPSGRVFEVGGSRRLVRDARGRNVVDGNLVVCETEGRRIVGRRLLSRKNRRRTAEDASFHPCAERPSFRVRRRRERFAQILRRSGKPEASGKRLHVERTRTGYVGNRGRERCGTVFRNGAGITRLNDGYSRTIRPVRNIGERKVSGRIGGSRLSGASRNRRG